MSDVEEEDDRFDELVADYLDAVANGEVIDESQIVAENPEFADQLHQFFSDHRRMGGLLDADPADRDATLPPSGKTRHAADAPTLHDSGFSLGDSSGYRSPAFYGVDPQQCIADYQLLDRLAEGGMGVVYKAKQLSLNRIVALKMIRTGEFADAEEVQRFQVEAEAAAKLTHPGIVPIYQIGEDKGQHFFSMALVEGSSLADLIRQEPMKPRLAAEYVAQVARAVHYAHEQGIIHRDIKPANVLVDQNNQPKVTDFGLAKQITSDHELTMSGQILGTASYMSPEQAAGKEVTPLADVYSLGALLYALLTKRPPFIGSNPVDILMDVLSKDPATPSALKVSVSRDLETICMRCLEKDPLRRYASGAELADDLERYLDGTPILARPVGRIEKWARWCQRRPAAATAILLAVMLCLAAAAYYTKEGKSRFFRGDSPRQVVQRGLRDAAVKHYQGISVQSATARERLLVLAGEAMLHDSGQGAVVDPSSTSRFEALSEKLVLLLEAPPNDERAKSALADCYVHLARQRIPSYDPDDARANVVREADVDKVRGYLDLATGLLEELRTAHPDVAELSARLTTARSLMQRLPGTFEERMTHLLAAGELKAQFDDAYGVVRFDVVPPGPPDSKDRELTVEREATERLLRQASEKLQSNSFLAAISAYQAALNSPAIEPQDYLQAFDDLAVMASREPGAVELALADLWPEDAERFYYAMLGIKRCRLGRQVGR